jgi:hypothetical protein
MRILTQSLTTFRRIMTLTWVGESTHRRGRHLWANSPTKAEAVSVGLHSYPSVHLAKQKPDAARGDKNTEG